MFVNGTVARGGHSYAEGQVLGDGPDPAFCGGADDGNRTRMASLEGVSRVAVRAAELGDSLPGRDRD
jgi:hypothetical protein